MSENESDDSSFVVITGNPQEGKGERISRVRSHIMKRRHQQGGRLQALVPRPLVWMSPYNGLHYTPVPTGLLLADIGHQRMQSFLDQYLYYSHNVHPSFRIVVLAAATYAPLMSAKILTASTWDDLNNVGEISNLTLEQGVITRQLINESFNNVHEASSDVNIAALISILIFDLVNEDRHAFYQHKRIIQGLIHMRGGMQVLGFDGHLVKSMPLIELLQKVAKIATPVDCLYEPGDIFPIFCKPLDLKVFTFERHQSNSPESTTPLLAMLLGHFSDLLFLARECASHLSSAKVQKCYLEQCATMHRDLITIRSLIANDTDTIPKAILHAALLFSWSGSASKNVDLKCWSASWTALQTSLRQPDIDQLWVHLPGALIWCLVIGARLAQLDSARKWFMMQLVRVTSCIALDRFDEVLQSLQIMIGGLDAAETLNKMTELYGPT